MFEREEQNTDITVNSYGGENVNTNFGSNKYRLNNNATMEECHVKEFCVRNNEQQVP